MAVPRIYQHRVLFWGILGALVMRGVMIAVGAELIARHHWILYIFGVFLLVTAVKMLVIREHSDPAQSIAVRWAKRWLPVTDRFHGEHFIVRAGSLQSRKAAAPGAAPLPDAAIERAVPRQVDADAIGVGAHSGGDHRPHICGGFDPSDFRHHRGPVSGSSRAMSSRSSGCEASTSPLRT
jgi:hypothetical protein